MLRSLRLPMLIIGLILLWQLLVTLTQLPPYILPPPHLVWESLTDHLGLILSEAKLTLFETLIGFALGALFANSCALSMVLFKPLKHWLLPMLLISQALPTFAIAPLLVIWLGYGMSAKIATTVLMVFFPIASSFFDGLRKTPLPWQHLAHTMNATRLRFLWHIQIPAALPSLASGLRVAAAMAPMGAVIGEWVGASRGLGYLMLNSNARMQIDLMFASLISLIIMTLVLYFSVDWLLKKWINWEVQS